MTTNNNLPPQPAYEQYRGLRALLLTRVSTPGQSHEVQERVIREKLIEPLGLILDEERHVIHDTYTGLEYRYRAALDDILSMAERQEFDLLCLDVLDRGLGRKGVSREIFRGQLRELGIHILTTEPSDHSDDDSLEGQLMRLLKGYKAEEEVNDFVRRSKNAIRHKALGDPEKGIPPKVIGKGIRTYGYKFVCDSKGKRESLELNYDVIWVDCKGVEWTEVRVVAFMFRCAKRRIGIRQICKRLNDIGIPAPSITIGRKYKSRGLQAEKVMPSRKLCKAAPPKR
jgi:DNA invertase Pin-like site-specific DNA recombinase